MADVQVSKVAIPVIQPDVEHLFQCEVLPGKPTMAFRVCIKRQRAQRYVQKHEGCAPTGRNIQPTTRVLVPRFDACADCACGRSIQATFSHVRLRRPRPTRTMAA